MRNHNISSIVLSLAITLSIPSFAENKPQAATADGKEIWAKSRYFDDSPTQAQWLKGRTQKNEHSGCVEISTLRQSMDHELKQIFIQALESDETFPSEKKCLEYLKSRAQISIQAVCVPIKGFSYDYSQQTCVPVSHDCTPAIRNFLESAPQRVFLKIYPSKKKCEAVKRLHAK